MKTIYLEGGSKHLTVKERIQGETMEDKKTRKSIQIIKNIRTIIKELRIYNNVNLDLTRINKVINELNNNKINLTINLQNVTNIQVDINSWIKSSKKVLKYILENIKNDGHEIGKKDIDYLNNTINDNFHTKTKHNINQSK